MGALMVRALLAGAKTETRRFINPQPSKNVKGVGRGFGSDPSSNINGEFWWLDHQDVAQANEASDPFYSPYGVPGDFLLVREGIRREGEHRSIYVADGAPTKAEAWPWQVNSLPGRFCPHGLSRITLELTAVRIERLLSITEEAALAEGIVCKEVGQLKVYTVPGTDIEKLSARAAYFELWDMLHGPNSHEANPWVWVLRFKRPIA